MKTHFRPILGLALLVVVALSFLVQGNLGAEAAPLDQGRATPTPIPPPPSSDLDALAAAVNRENVEWQNITFWVQGTLGDSRYEALGIAYRVGQVLPAFEMPVSEGESFDLTAIQEPTLLNFWASWCGPCQMELPLFLEMHADAAAPFQVVAVNVWDEPGAYENFALDEFPSTLLSGRAPADLPDQIGLQAVPVSILLDSNRTIVAVHVGNLTPAVRDLFYALATPVAALPALTEVPSTGEEPAPSLQDLAANAGRANRESGSYTIWQDGVIGVDGGLRIALRVGEKLSAFGFMTGQGDVFRLDLAGRPYLVNFWASWCGPCIEEFPLLVRYHQNPEAAFGVVFVNIWDDVYTYRAFLADYPADLLTMMDVEGWMPDWYRFDFIPLSVLVDEQGLVQMIQMGSVNEAVLEFANRLLTSR